MAAIMAQVRLAPRLLPVSYQRMLALDLQALRAI